MSDIKYIDNRTKDIYILIENNFKHPNYGEVIVLKNLKNGMISYVIPVCFDDMFSKMT